MEQGVDGAGRTLHAPEAQVATASQVTSGSLPYSQTISAPQAEFAAGGDAGQGPDPGCVPPSAPPGSEEEEPPHAMRAAVRAAERRAFMPRT